MASEIDGKWHIFNESNNQWFDILKKYPEATFLSDNEWAIHLKNFGWESLKIIKVNKRNNSRTLLQGFVKLFPL